MFTTQGSLDGSTEVFNDLGHIPCASGFRAQDFGISPNWAKNERILLFSVQELHSSAENKECDRDHRSN
jgi:hypothetical protein